MYHKYELEFPNSWQDILNVAETKLTGELEYRRGNYTLAFEQLRESIKYYNNMIYAEPWGWMQPQPQCLHCSSAGAG